MNYAKVKQKLKQRMKMLYTYITKRQINQQIQKTQLVTTAVTQIV